MKTYLRHRIINLVDVKELIALEYLDFKGKYAVYSEHHNFWELCYIESGSVVCQIENKEICGKTGDLIFIPPDHIHSYKAENDNFDKAFVICFESLSQSLKTLAGMCISLTQENQQILIKIIDESQHTFQMDKNDHLCVVDMPNLGGQQVILLHLELLLISILRNISFSENTNVIFLNHVDFYEDLVKIITDYLSENIMDKLSLNDICHKVNYSKSFLCKIFKKQTGKSLFSFFNQLKITEAKRLLVETDFSAAKISNMLGISDPKYFNTLFKKITGMTPSGYKKTHKEDLKKLTSNVNY